MQKECILEEHRVEEQDVFFELNDDAVFETALATLQLSLFPHHN